MPVDCREDGTAVFALKNRFFKGEELELLQPGHAPYSFHAEAVNDDGEALDLFNVPQMKVHFQFPFAVDRYAILRKKNGTSRIKQNILPRSLLRLTAGCFLCSVLCPVKRASDRLVPSIQQPAALLIRHRGSIKRIAAPQLLELVPAAPDAGCQTCKIARAERRRLADDRTTYRAVRNVSLKLHKKAVTARAAIHRKGR